MFEDFAIFDKIRGEKCFFENSVIFRNLEDFCSISMTSPRKYIPAKYGHFYQRENKYPRKLMPIRYFICGSLRTRILHIRCNDDNEGGE